MANGDHAVAAGLAVVPSTAKANLTYDEINKTRDYLVDRVFPLSQGGTGATTKAAARTALGLDDVQPISKGGTGATDRDGALANIVGFTPCRMEPGSATTFGFYTTNFDAVIFRGDSSSAAHDHPVQLYGQSVDTGGGSLRSLGARNQGITSNYATMSADGSGLFGIPSSSRSKKKDLAEWDDEQCDRFIERVHAYEGRYKTDAETDPLRPFMILEEFEDAGFGEFVVRDAETGDGIGLHYDLVSVALLAIVRRHNDRLTALEQRMQEIEERAE